MAVSPIRTTSGVRYGIVGGFCTVEPSSISSRRRLARSSASAAGVPGSTRSVGCSSRPSADTVTSPNRPSWKCSVAASGSGKVTSTFSTGSNVTPAGRGRS
ncbi:MAG TPA: hypothetical protein VGJ95_18595 [Pseudonocardiaceae bacterium]